MQTWDGLPPGALVADRYRVMSQLARGGFGAVYIAEQLATERHVALKVLWPHLLSGKGAIEQFMLEARVASRVNSEHIVQVLDAGIDTRNDMPFLVMELLRGQDLQKTVKLRGPLERSVALEYLRQTASGLDKAHAYIDREGRRAPIVHRDLKPENLFLSQREDGSPIIKILDFGIAKVLSQSTQLSGDIKGTPLYMAFEQASQGAITPATDIWALGLVAFYLLTGACYWKAANSTESNMTQLFGEILTWPIVAPSERAKDLGVNVELGADFDGWFMRCVNRDPKQRFQRASEAIAALYPALSAELKALPSSVVSRPRLDSSQDGARLSQGDSTQSPSLRDMPTQDHAALGHTMAPGRARRRPLLLIGLGLAAALGGIVFAVAHGSVDAPLPTAPAANTPASNTSAANAPASGQVALPAPGNPQPEPAVSANTGPTVTAAEPDASASSHPPLVSPRLPVTRPFAQQSQSRPASGHAAPARPAHKNAPKAGGDDIYGER